MIEKIVIAGFGGQGVMSIGKLLCYAGMLESKHVAWIPSYGPEMRGGTANCSVTVSSESIGSPVISVPTTAIVLNKPSLDKFAPMLKKGGILLINSSLITEAYHSPGIKSIEIQANDMAEKLGNGKVANMILLGAFVQMTGAVSIDSIVKSLKKVWPKVSQEVINLNRSALALGATIVSEQFQNAVSI